MLEVPAKYIAAVQSMSEAWLLSGRLMRCGSHVQLGAADKWLLTGLGLLLLHQQPGGRCMSQAVHGRCAPNASPLWRTSRAADGPVTPCMPSPSSPSWSSTPGLRERIPTTSTTSLTISSSPPLYTCKDGRRERDVHECPHDM